MASSAEVYLNQIAINNYHHTFSELMAQMGRALADLGYTCIARFVPTQEPREVLVPGAFNIVCGHVAFAAERMLDVQAGAPFVLWQLEPLSDTRGILPLVPAYRALMHRATRLWDYSPANVATVRRWGWPLPRHLPLSDDPALAVVPADQPKDKDVCFFGWMSPRRKALAKHLDQAGLRVVARERCYGEERNALIARSHLALNVHAFDDLAVLEEARLSFLLVNRCFVVSETADHDPYDGGVVYADYDRLVETCRHWLAQPEAARALVAERGLAALRRRPFREALRGAIEEAWPAVMEQWQRAPQGASPHVPAGLG